MNLFIYDFVRKPSTWYVVDGWSGSLALVYIRISSVGADSSVDTYTLGL